MGRRAGVTLLEVLVAATAAGVVSIAALSVLRHLVAGAARDAARARADAAATEALTVTRALLDASAGVRSIGDSGLALDLVVSDLVPCVDGTASPLVPSTDMTIEIGDRWHALAWRAGTAGVDSLAWQVVEPRPLPLASARCASTDPAMVMIRISRSVQVAPYQSSDGSWMLALRQCEVVCGPAQPVAGPLEPPERGGWRARMLPCGVELSVRSSGAPAWRSIVVPRC